MSETIAEFKRRKGTNYDERAARYDNIESLVRELVSRHRGDIPEAFAIALGDEIYKRVAELRKDRVLINDLVDLINTIPSGWIFDANAATQWKARRDDLLTRAASVTAEGDSDDKP